jgi:hypothetical protein
MSFNQLFDKNTPRELDLLCTYIYDVYSDFKDKKYNVEWTKNSKDFDEYGFSLKSLDKNATIYFGLWWQIWEYHGYPLCISLDWNEKKFTTDILQRKLKLFFDNNEDKFSEFIIKETYPTICLKLDFLNSLENEELLIKLIHDLMSSLGLSYGGLK